MNMDIAFGINDNFVMPCGVLIHSIIKTNREARIRFHIVTEHIQDKNKLKMLEVARGSGCELIFHEIKDAHILTKLPNYAHFTLATYYRFFLPDLLSKDITKILYLDADMLCVDSIKELWETDITDYAIGAVTEPDQEKATITNRLGDVVLKDGEFYFNAGVLLINLDYWRHNGIAEKSIRFLEEHPVECIWPDQDALNVITAGQRKLLPYKFNCTNVWKDIQTLCVRKAFFDDIEAGRKNPVIIHFNQCIKPWHKESSHPCKDVWRLVKSQTPWKRCKPQSMYKGIDRFRIIRILKLILPKIFGRRIFEVLHLAKHINANTFPLLQPMYERFK